MLDESIRSHNNQHILLRYIEKKLERFDYNVSWTHKGTLIVNDQDCTVEVKLAEIGERHLIDVVLMKMNYKKSAEEILKRSINISVKVDEAIEDLFLPSMSRIIRLTEELV